MQKVRPANPIFPPGSYILVNNGEVVWHSAEINSNRPADTARRQANDSGVLETYPDAKLFFRVQGAP